MGNVLGFNYFPGMCAILGERGKDEDYHSQAFKRLVEGVGGRSYDVDSLDEIAGIAYAELDKGTKVVSGDHAVSHPLFEAVNRKRPRFNVGRREKLGALVVDQHVDAYRYGKGVKGNNVYRRLIEGGIVDNVVVLGVRPSEYALFTGRKDDRKGLPFYNKVTARVFHREFDGMHGRIKAVPLISAGNLADAMDVGLREFAQRGIAHVGIDVDADGFDSGQMTGVGYSTNALGKFHLPERIFIKNQLMERGMPVNDIHRQMAAANDVLRGYRNVNVFFKNLTEIDPNNEFPATGNTETLVRAFVENF